MDLRLLGFRHYIFFFGSEPSSLLVVIFFCRTLRDGGHQILVCKNLDIYRVYVMAPVVHSKLSFFTFSPMNFQTFYPIYSGQLCRNSLKGGYVNENYN